MSDDIKKQIDIAVKDALEVHLPISVATKILPAIDAKIDAKVNGKIDALRKEVKENNQIQVEAMAEQNEKLNDLIKKTEGVIEIYNDSKGFWNVIKALASFIIPLTVVIGGIMAFKEWIKQ